MPTVGRLWVDLIRIVLCHTRDLSLNNLMFVRARGSPSRAKAPQQSSPPQRRRADNAGDIMHAAPHTRSVDGPRREGSAGAYGPASAAGLAPPQPSLAQAFDMGAFERLAIHGGSVGESAARSGSPEGDMSIELAVCAPATVGGQRWHHLTVLLLLLRMLAGFEGDKGGAHASTRYGDGT